MSANNQTLIKEYKGKWYVFTDIMAESWSDGEGNYVNELHLKSAKGVYDSRDEAYSAALELDRECGQFQEGTEYGVHFERLVKDDKKVKIVE